MYIEFWFKVWKQLSRSIVSNDFFILVCAIVTLFIFFILLIVYHDCVNRKYKMFKFINVNLSLSQTFTFFKVLISIFPMLGMLGTISAFLVIDFDNGNISSIKDNFFPALTSTAWGIIFSIIFKILYSLIKDRIEQQIERDCKTSINSSM